jgi:hypothetical protein
MVALRVTRWAMLADQPHARPPKQSAQTAAPDAPPWWQFAILDVAVLVIGVSMAFFARRFAPILWILGGPVLAYWITRLGAGLPARWRATLEDVVLIGAWPAFALVVFFTGQRALAELYNDRQKNLSLLWRVTQYGEVPHAALNFLKDNNISGNFYTEWKLGGVMMFETPQAKVFIDGRAQQVYSEQQYTDYNTVLNGAANDPRVIFGILDRAKTDAVLLPNWAASSRIGQMLESGEPNWLRVFEIRPVGGVIWARRDSALFAELVRRERAGELRWPEAPTSLARRGTLLVGGRMPTETGRPLP